MIFLTVLRVNFVLRLVVFIELVLALELTFSPELFVYECDFFNDKLNLPILFDKALSADAELAIPKVLLVLKT